MAQSLHSQITQARVAQLTQKELDVVNNLKNQGLLPIKDIIDHKNNKAYDRYFQNHPKDTHTKEELDALTRAIMYTKMFKQDESLAKMDEEEILIRPVGAKFRGFGNGRKGKWFK